MKVLGIDPGTATTGWGIVKNKDGETLELINYGCIETPKEMEMSERLLMLNKNLEKLLGELKPDIVVIEQLFFGVNSKTAMSVGQARGVVMMTIAEQKIPIKEYQGLAVKLTLTGYGRADKKQIQETVKRTLRLSDVPKPDDAADALGVAICHIFKEKKGEETKANLNVSE